MFFSDDCCSFKVPIKFRGIFRATDAGSLAYIEVVMSSRFYIIKFKDQIRLELGSISIYF
jgi:hypothetical protein